MNPTQIFEFAKNLINQKLIKLIGCNWAEFALGPDAQCVSPTPAALARPTRTALVWPAATPARPALCPAAARHRRTGDGGAAAHRRGDGGATATAMSDGRRRGARSASGGREATVGAARRAGQLSGAALSGRGAVPIAL
jgi:hypothetical protein